MTVEIDQSGRVEDLSTGTAVAFANEANGAIFVSAGIKRRLIIYLRRHSLIPARDLPAVLFGVLLFILIRDHQATALKIDEEYTGKNVVIEEILKKLFVRQRTKRIPTIRFVRIGKRSSAHLLAWRVHRSKGKLLKVRRITEKEILKFI